MLRALEISGNYAGQLHCLSLLPPASGNSGIIIGGDLSGLVRIHADGTPQETIWIGGSLTSAGDIVYDEDFGLTNQVIINGLDDGGTWGGEVVIGAAGMNAITLAPSNAPYYVDLPEDIGGGSVGLAVFNLHGTACTPFNGETQVNAETQDIVLRHYGPVAWDDQTYDSPVNVYYRQAGSSGAWTLLGEGYYFVTGTGDLREFQLTATTQLDFSIVWDYKIEPKAGVLYCLDVAGNPDVYSYQYFLYGEP